MTRQPPIALIPAASGAPAPTRVVQPANSARQLAEFGRENHLSRPFFSTLLRRTVQGTRFNPSYNVFSIGHYHERVDCFSMNPLCETCSGAELNVVINSFRFGLRLLAKLVMNEKAYFCPSCGHRTTDGLNDLFVSDSAVRRTEIQDTHTANLRRRQAYLEQASVNGRFVSVQFPAIYRSDRNVLLPTFEGRVQDGTSIGPHGDPDLMLGFAEQYFKIYNLAMPAGRLPHSLVEIMPPLHLLVTAAELGFKASLIRDGKDAVGHLLQPLYDDLDAAQRDRIDAGFSESSLNTHLTELGIEPAPVRAILGRYDSTYEENRGVYMDSRYYAEPTSRLRDGLRGVNVVKCHTPYPIFLPEIVSAQIETYWFFSGHEQLRRRGGDVQYGARAPGKENHGEWSMIPSSLGLIVLSVSQPSGISAEGEDLKAFQNLLSESPPGLRISSSYGGNTLLFYKVGERCYTDGVGTVNEVQCRMWRHQRIGIHSRDLYRLAGRLEDAAPFGSLSNARIVRTGGR